MENVVFPFLSLPRESQINVLKTMGILEIVFFSLYSKKTKNMVISLKLTAEQVEVNVGDNIVVSVAPVDIDGDWLNLGLYRRADVGETDGFIPLPHPNVLHISYGQRWTEYEKFQWSKSDYEMRDCVEHILSVFHHSTIDELNFEYDCARFDVKSIHEALKGCSTVELGIEETEGKATIASQQALEVFCNTPEIYVGVNPFKGPRSIQKVLVRNYNQILIDFPFTFADLLTINSPDISIFDYNLTEKDLNRFLKLWIRGSNSRLEHFKIEYASEKDEAKILEDIRYTRNPVDQQKEFITSFTIPNQFGYDVHGGCDLKRRDGTLATITVENEGGSCEINMFVWLK